MYSLSQEELTVHDRPSININNSNKNNVSEQCQKIITSNSSPHASTSCFTRLMAVGSPHRWILGANKPIGWTF